MIEDQPSGEYADRKQKEGETFRSWLNAEDQGALRRWREALILQDSRCEHKGLLKLVVLAMTDEQFRQSLVNDRSAALAKFLGSGLTLPADITFNFYENTRDTVNIVLPPRAGAMKQRTPALRDVLRSGTAKPLASDDLDHGNLGWGDTNHGDHTAFDGGHHY
jgi:hypothetical protein